MLVGEGVLVWEPHGGGYSGGQRPTPVSGHLSEPEQKGQVYLLGLISQGLVQTILRSPVPVLPCGLLTVLWPSRAHLSGTIG